MGHKTFQRDGSLKFDGCLYNNWLNLFSMQLPLSIAKKIQQLLRTGERLASSSMQHAIVNKMLEDGLLQKQITGKTKGLIFIDQPTNVAAYLHNHFGISNLEEYIASFDALEQTRANNVLVSGNSKLQLVRTFKGFLVNSYQPVAATLAGEVITIAPLPGTYTFIHDYEHFVPDPTITIIGIENPENFRRIHEQRYLFAHLQPLFVSRYPQSNDLVKWLASIPNAYLHFGDLDFAGIRIYQSEFKKHLGDKARFFLPPNTEALLQQYGNRDLFNKQYALFDEVMFEHGEPGIQALIQLLLKYKKVLEQELLITSVAGK